MKKWILILMMVTMYSLSLGYDAEYYRDHISQARTGSRTSDPIYLCLQELYAGLTAQGTGNVYYVDSNVGYEGDGKSWTSAKNTLDEAVNLCTANNGDIIYVAQGHAENLSGADGVDVDIAGVTIIGLGNGQLRPTFSYTAGAGEFVLGANGDNSKIYNMRFIATVDSVVHAIDVEAACVGWAIIGCEFKAETTTVDEFDDVITVGAAADEGTIACNRFLGDPGSNGEPQSCINFVDCDYLQIIGNECFGDRAVACIQNETTASNHIVITGNYLFNGIIGGTAGLNTEPAIELVDTTTGIIYDNVTICNVATPDAAIVAADCFLAGNKYSETEGGFDAPPTWLTTDSALNMIGFDDADNVYASTNVASNADGSILEREEYIQAEVAKIPKSDGTSSWNATALAAIEAEATDAVEADSLDKLVAADDSAGATAYPDSVAQDSILAYLMASDASPVITGYDNTTDSLEAIADRDISILSYLVNGTPDKLTTPANTFTILDILGTDGSTTTGAVAGSLLGAIGTNEAAADTPFTSATVEEDANGSLLERAEFLQIKSDDILASMGVDSAVDNIYYVDSVAANGGTGVSWAQSEDTLKAAIDDATNSTGAIIFVAANHTEDIAASVAIDCPGVKIIGLGVGNARPTLNFTAAGSVFAHTVANVMYKNIIFVSNTIDTTVGITLDASSDGAIFEDCEFRTSGGFEFLSCITFAIGTDDVRITRCKFENAGGGVNATEAIQNTTGVTDNMIIEDCEFYGAWTAAAIFSDDADTNVIVRNNLVQNTSTGVHAIEFSAAALGTLKDNLCYADTWGAIIDPGSLKCFGNKQAVSTDAAAIDFPLQAGKTYAMTASVDEVSATLFDVQNGEIIVNSFVGLVDVLIGATPTNCQIQVNADDGAAWDVDLSTAVAIETDVAGTKYVFTNVNPSVLTPLQGAGTGGTILTSGWFVPEGLLIQTMSADPGGAVGDHITWYMVFTPVSDGVIVVPGT